MDLTSGTRVTATAAAVMGLGGLGLTLHGVWRDQLTHSLGGVVITIVALTAIVLTVIRCWITNTNIERTILAAAQRETQAERTRYIAAQAALENEQVRLRRDLDAERVALTEAAKVERAAVANEFEERKAVLISETMEATVLMFNNGKFAPEATAAGKLIRFPRQEPVTAPQCERSREHGVVGP